MNPYKVVEDFEHALCEFTGAPHAVAVDSCTNAILLALMARRKREDMDDFPPLIVELPKHTYVGVARAAKNIGARVQFNEVKWVGEYEIPRYHVVDAAKWLRRGMYQRHTLTCLSFQAYKQLPIGRGGAILCDDLTDAEWFRKARFDGRDMSVSLYDQKSFGWGMHCPMPPDFAARGLWLMQGLPKDMPPIGSWKDYPDLSLKEWT